MNIEPVVSIGIDKAEDGTFTATMIVSGLASLEQANVAANLMQEAFCGEEYEGTDHGH